MCLMGVACKEKEEPSGENTKDCFNPPVIASIDSLSFRVREIVILPGSGTPPFTYSVDSFPFDDNPIRDNLIFGSHFVYIKDAVGCCSERFDFTVTPPRIIPPEGSIDGPYVVSWDELRGTQWKLYSIDHNERGRKILEPEDCDTCYTLTFDKDETGYFFSGVSIQNTVNIRIGYDIENQQKFDIEVLVTGVDEPFDGNLFCETLKLVEVIGCDGRFFHLHFNDCGGFSVGHGNCNGTMLFKRINQ